MTGLKEEITSELQQLSTDLIKYITVSLMSGNDVKDLLPKHIDVYVQNIISKFEKRIDEIKPPISFSSSR